MNRRFFTASAALLFALSAFTYAQDAPAPAAAAPPAATANPNAPSIKGTMSINYITRQPQGMEGDAPKKGAQDTYSVDLMVNGTNQFQGEIKRQPRIKQLGIRTVQQPRYDYNVSMFVMLKDGSKPNVGTWVGPMAIDEKTGAFSLEAQGDRALRLNITAGSGFTDNYGGTFYGKAADKSKLSIESIKRTINGKEIEKKFEADPIKFAGVRLAKGPNPKQYPNATVTGELSYDRETANYYAKDLTFAYQTPEGKGATDVVTGTIKWVEDPQRESNGKGYYEFNLRYNEDKNTPAKSDDEQFGGASDDDLFFAVDKSIPALTGTIQYVDQFAGSVAKGGDGKPLPVSSMATYDLKANNLNNQQVMNFAKLWLIAVGPTNDE